VKLFHTDFLVTLRVSTHEGDPPPGRVLARALKALWRVDAVKCVEAQYARGGGQDGAGDVVATTGGPGVNEAPRGLPGTETGIPSGGQAS
jgi:hypothetical protein